MLKEYRRKIDKIDSEIIKLLSDRLKISLKVGNYKKENGFGIVDLKREKEIFYKLIAEGKELGLGESYIKKVFEVIIMDSRRNQKF